MDTRKKLSEAKFFLDELSYVTDASDFTKVNYFLSAFLGAWRSVLDYMLYDFSEYYSLGISREDYMNVERFEIVAKRLKKTKGVEFINWFKQKQKILNNNPLLEKRVIIVHRGYPPIKSISYVQNSVLNIGTISSEVLPFSRILIYDPIPTLSLKDQYYLKFSYSYEVISFSDFSDMDIVGVCVDAQEMMETIVDEAETKFGVKL